jgi:hypothetical protein
LRPLTRNRSCSPLRCAAKIANVRNERPVNRAHAIIREIRPWGSKYLVAAYPKIPKLADGASARFARLNAPR